MIVAIATLEACGTDNPKPPPPPPEVVKFTGTAAGGLAAGSASIKVVCQGGSGTGTATAGADGTYSVTIDGGIAPCLVQATDPVTTNVYYSAVPSGATVANVTPLTSLVLANAIGVDPATAFANFSPSIAANVTTATLNAAINTVTAALQTALGVNISGMNPLTLTLAAATEGVVGDAQDQQITQLAVALNNANVPLSTLTSALASNSSAAAATTALSGIVSANNIGTSALPGCPYAVSGNYVAGGPHNQNADFFPVIDFSAMTVTVGSTNSFTISTVSDSSGNLVPCSYTWNAPGNTIYVSVSQSGAAVAGLAPSSTSFTPGFTPFSTQGVYLMVPAQPLTLAQIPSGISNGVVFAASAASPNQPEQTALLQYTISGTVPGTGTYVECPNETAPCSGAFGSYTMAGPNPNGTFTVTVGTEIFTNVYYRSISGDMIGFNIAANATTWADWFQVYTQRVSASPIPAVGATYSGNFWLVVNYTNSSGGASIESEAVHENYTVTSTSTNTSPQSQTRIDGFGNTTTIYYADPFAGMLTASQNGWYGVTATGFTAFDASQFFGMAVNTP
jgi:hypothetical protein